MSRTSPRTGWSPRWCRRRASTRCASPRTSRTRTSPARPRPSGVLETLRGRTRRGARRRRRGKRGFLGFGKARAAKTPAGPRGVYLDGGYGVGKTHLLASLWHATPAEPALKAFGTFVELTNLVGALGFQQTVQTLSGHRLLCIDEFELDDPGDTVLVSTLLGRLVDAGVALAATSNTLPGKLGEGRFASADFLREIQGLSAHFRAAAHRRRGLPPPRPARGAGAVLRRAGDEGRVRHRRAPRSTTSRTSSTTSPRSTPAATAR